MEQDLFIFIKDQFDRPFCYCHCRSSNTKSVWMEPMKYVSCTSGGVYVPFYLQACQVRVTVRGSGLCYCACTCDVIRALINSLVCWLIPCTVNTSRCRCCCCFFFYGENIWNMRDVQQSTFWVYEWYGMMMMMSWCLMSSDVIWHIRDKLWPMPKHGSIKSTYVRCMRV